MKPFQRNFIELARQREVLLFGRFTLKSGRTSPYFFNAGRFQTGAALAALGKYYAQAIVDSDIKFDVLFGPAYKGIPLVAAVAIALAEHFDRDVPYCFNRKEAKAHGEGGQLVGAPLAGRVLVVDDVITAGTAIREVMTLIKAQPNAEAVAVMVGLDRKERGQGELSAVQEVIQTYGVPVEGLIDIDCIIDYLRESATEPELLQRVTAYRESYGV